MSTINYDNRFFRSVNNSATGEVSAETVFHLEMREYILEKRSYL